MSTKLKDNLDKFIHVLKAEQIQEYRKWANEIPFIPFKKDWEVQPIPPFGGTIVRFCVRRKDKPEKQISVYLDCYGRLGAMDKPYWEIYPYKGDTYRCYLSEVNELVAAIEHEFGNKRRFLTKS